MQLLVAVKERWPGIVRRKIHLDLLLGGHHDYVFHNTHCCLASEPGDFKAMPVQVNRVRFITLIIEAKAVPTIGTHSNRIGLGEGFSVDGPVIYPAGAGEFLAEDERHDAAGRLRSLRVSPKRRVIPRGIRRCGPPRRAAAVRIFHHDAQPGIPHLIVGLSEDPHSRLVHRNKSVDALCRTHLDDVHLSRQRHNVPVQADDFEFVTGQGDAVLLSCAGIQDAKKHLLTFFHAHRIA